MPSPAVLFETSRPLSATPATTDPTALAAALAAASERWLDGVRYRHDDRWTRLLATPDAADLLQPDLHRHLSGAQIWLLSWLPGQGTPLHDHGRSAGAFAVVRGELTERVVSTGPAGARQASTQLGVHRVRRFGPHYVHQVTNEGAEPAVSVHVYTPVLREMNTYDVADGRLFRTGTERAGVDW